ncbi:MAG: Unknown protein [uncultured Sulfurovum sp.]|uniref:Uncharacterized protein n=1 Tax=uncultured Sulfurovum sp. TaxID=269237 RepID=A0A6S6S4W2_9BACT|nr:MAG: Unknown protein [uncultured Sulfurovum sp.]
MSTDNNSTEPEEIYSLETILTTLTTVKNNVAKKRLISDQEPIGGISVKWVITFLISLPIMLYAGIFNPVMFEMLGIAQAIIFFVVFLSMVIILAIATVFINNNKVLRQITPSWNKYFEGVDLKLALASAGTPYTDFFKHYNIALNEGLTGKALEERLQQGFATMEEENKSLMDAMRRNDNKR